MGVQFLPGAHANLDMRGENKKKNKIEEIQDEIFRKMPAEKKINLACRLSDFCLKLNSLHGNIRPRKTSIRNN